MCSFEVLVWYVLKEYKVIIIDADQGAKKEVIDPPLIFQTHAKFYLILDSELMVNLHQFPQLI